MGMLGRYGVKIEFEDGETGYFMGVDKYDRNCIYTTKNWDVANKYLTESGAVNAYNEVSNGYSINGSRIACAWLSKDRETIGSKIRRNW